MNYFTTRVHIITWDQGMLWYLPEHISLGDMAFYLAPQSEQNRRYNDTECGMCTTCNIQHRYTSKKSQKPHYIQIAYSYFPWTCNHINTQVTRYHIIRAD